MISAFVATKIVQSLYNLNLKFQSVAAQTFFCQSWSETSKKYFPMKSSNQEGDGYIFIYFLGTHSYHLRNKIGLRKTQTYCFQTMWVGRLRKLIKFAIFS